MVSIILIKTQENAYDMMVKKKDAQLNNLKYLSKMHSTKETCQNINHGYV